MAAQSGPTVARITVLISGSGTNLQALIDASHTSALPNVQFVRVISDRKDAYGLQRASSAHIPTAYHGILPYKKSHPDPDASSSSSSSSSSPPQFLAARKAYDADLAALILADRPDLVVCAGFMRILTPACLDPLGAAAVPIINLHPALHGDLVGAGCIERAWAEFAAGRRRGTGIMIHYVIAEVDMGAPIVQRALEIEGCATLDALQVRVHAAEHELIVEGTRVAVERKMGGGNGAA